MTGDEFVALAFLFALGAFLYNRHAAKKRRQATAEAPALPDLDRALAELAERPATEATKATEAGQGAVGGEVPLRRPLTTATLQPARTHTFDALGDLDADLRLLLDALERSSTPINDNEVDMASKLAGHLRRTLGDRAAIQREVQVRGQGRESGARIDMVFRGKVAIEIKRCDEDKQFSTTAVQNAIGQIRKYATLWPGPVIFVILSPYERNFDTRLKAELASPELANRPGGPVIAVWKARGQALRIVRPEAAVAAALATAPTIH